MRVGYLAVLVAFGGAMAWAPTPAVAGLKDDEKVCDNSAAQADERIATCTRIINAKLNKGNRLAIDHVSRGLALQKKQEFAAALNDFDTALRINPKSVHAYYRRGWLNFVRYNLDRALADFNAALDLDANHSSSQYGRMVTQMRKGNYDLALSDYERTQKLLPGNASVAIVRGMIHSAMGESDRAIEAYTDIIRKEPLNEMAISKRANLLTSQGEYDRAILDTEEAIRLNPQSSDHLTNRARWRTLRGNFDGALLDYDEAIRLDPTSASIFCQRASFWTLRGEFDRASADIEKAIQLNPNYPSAYTERADVWLRKGNLPNALADADKALGITASLSDALAVRAQVRAQMGDPDRAIADFDRSLKLASTVALNFARRGLEHEKRGNRDKAIGDFRMAMSAKSGSIDDIAQARSIAGQRLKALEVDPPIASLPGPAPAQNSVANPPAALPPAPPSPVAALAPPSVAAKIAPAAAPLGNRIALVIGNSEYKSVPVLPNPRRDAIEVTKALRQVGFQSVTVANDLPRDKMVEALRAFALQADEADWAMVYYAGHGIEVGGMNYMIPVDARLASDRDVQFEAVSLDQVMSATEGAHKLHLVLLDACRDNPFANKIKRTVASRSIGRGLAQVEPDVGTLVVFAAKDGQVAMDGDGVNSPFAQAFVRNVTMPGVEINKLFRLVRDDVMAMTGRKQQPFSYGSVPGSEDFYFIGAAEANAR